MAADQTDNQDGGPTGQEERIIVRREPLGRPWLPVAIASAVALVILLLLLIPGILRYPDSAGSVISPEARDETNQALEDRIERLRSLLERDVCVADGAYALPGGEDGEPQSLTPEDRAALPPPAPEDTRPQPEAVPDTQAYSGESLLDLIDQATVLVIRAGDNGGMGTGFFVGPNLVLTNQHVSGANRGQKLFVASPSLGDPRPATLKAFVEPATHGAPDFALIAVDGATPAYLTFAPGVQRLTDVVAGGFPALVMSTDRRFQGLLPGQGTAPDAAVTEGTVTARQAGLQNAQVLLHTAQVTPGNSGGPLLDRCGRVVGVNTFIRAEEEGRMNYALAAETALAFLGANGVQARRVSDPCPAEDEDSDTQTQPDDGTDGGDADGDDS